MSHMLFNTKNKKIPTPFFIFHYKRDSRRAKRIYQWWKLKAKGIGRYWGELARDNLNNRDLGHIYKWIEKQINASDLTILLIGKETSSSRYIKYAIEKTHQMEKGMLGIYIHMIKGYLGEVDEKGKNPFDSFQIYHEGEVTRLSDIYPTYDWVSDMGHFNLNKWVTHAVNPK